jgi:hypothetical protein
MTKIIDRIGERYGKLVVVSRAENTKSGQAQWECQCDCGNSIVRSAVNIRRHAHKNMSSCGCARIKHGHGCKTRTYSSWLNMRSRCENPRHHKYPQYGGRGVTVSKRWMKFDAFLADMGERPPGMTLDRINNDGHYEPGNCRWATASEQQHNRRHRTITIGGETKISRQWAADLGISQAAMNYRIRKRMPAKLMTAKRHQARSDRA